MFRRISSKSLPNKFAIAKLSDEPGGIKHVTGNATGSFGAVIADPEEVKDRDYKVFFVDDSTLEHLTTGFTILDQATGEILLTGSSDLFGSSELEKKLIDGLKFSFDNDEVPEISTVEWTGRSNLIVDINDFPQLRVPIDFENYVLLLQALHLFYHLQETVRDF